MAAGRSLEMGRAATSSGRVPRLARPVQQMPKMTVTVADALAATLGNSRWHIRGNLEGATSGKDAESLHQLRVGVRRLRAALSADSRPG
jgi:hypothetical protein